MGAHDVGKTTLHRVLEAMDDFSVVTIDDLGLEQMRMNQPEPQPIEYKLSSHHIDTYTPSKNQLKKCAKRLHVWSQEQHICIYCKIERPMKKY